MSDNGGLSRGSKRKLTAFVAFLVLLFGGLSIGWYWAAGKLDEQAGLLTADLLKQGRNLECSERSVRGYPFRIGVFCEKIAYADPAAGISVSGQGLRSAAQLYRPGHVVGELVSPYEVVFPGLAPLTIDWENLKSSFNFATSGLRRLSVVADRLAISANDFGQRDLLGSVNELQLHARASDGNDGNDLEVALSGNQWQIDDNEAGVVEPVSFSLDGQVDDGFAMVQSGQPLEMILREKGGRLELSGFEFITNSGGSLRIKGPLEVSRSGKVSGKLSLDLEDPQKLINYVVSVFPPAEQALANTSQYLDAVADKSGDKVRIRDLQIQIRDGDVFLGFIQIGEIPRLF